MRSVIAAVLCGVAHGAIERQRVVERHSVKIGAVNAQNVSNLDVLAVGNGQFVFNVGIDGLQTFNGTYITDVNTMAEWAWHIQPWSQADPTFALRSYNFSYIPTATDGNGGTRDVPYYVGNDGFGNSTGDVVDWLMANPHKMNLGQLGLRWAVANGTTVQTLPVDIVQLANASLAQDMWLGTVSSNYTLTYSSPPLSNCGIVPENAVLSLSCGSPGLVITGVGYAQYGNVSGSCGGGFTVTNCSSATSLATVLSLCVGQPYCDITASNGVFGTDPCPQTVKSLAVSGLQCGPATILPPSGPVSVSTTSVVHPDVDLVGTRLAWTGGTANGTAAPMALRLAFPYASGNWGPPVSDWSNDALHSTAIVSSGPQHVTLMRSLDSDCYRVDCAWSDPTWAWARVAGYGNVFELTPPPTPGNTSTSGHIDLQCLYSPPGLAYPAGAWQAWVQAKTAATAAMMESMPTTIDSVLQASAQAWAAHWYSGAFLDLAFNTTDPRAFELERRAVLSQYLLRIHNAGAEPPAETGLLCNSWSGQHHLEMRYWHHAHWALWGRPDLLARSDGFYQDLLPNVSAYAAFQGYKGARWLKETASVLNRTGIDVPWLGLDYAPYPFHNGSVPDGQGTLLTWEAAEIANALVVWQQPHVIWLADVQRRVANATGGPAAALAVMTRLQDLVFATADYLSSRPYLNGSDTSGGQGGTYWLGPPLMGAEEMGGGPSTPLHNPTFETMYFASMLDVANAWRVVLGTGPDPVWTDVAAHMARPVVDIGSDPAAPTYTFNLDCACVFSNAAHCPPGRAGKTVCNPLQSHPAMVAVHGMLNAHASPRGDDYGVDMAIHNRTVAAVVGQWDWGSPTVGTNTWGWDYGLVAMSMTRLGWSPDAIVDFLLLPTVKNSYMPNGHNYQQGSLPAYLPGNGALLLSLAMLAGGSDSSPALYFPPAWAVQAEGFPIAFP